MLGVLIVASVLLVDGPAGPAEQDSYERALEQVGRGAEAQVRLALWCEAHGLDAERVKHLSLAVLKDPAHPLARALMGMVSRDGRWTRPEAVGAVLAGDETRKAVVAQYEAKRDKLPETADAHWKL